MSTLFRYIARMYLVNLVALFVILFSLVVTVDVVINLDRFSDRAAEMTGQAKGIFGGIRHTFLTAWLIADLWGPRLLQLFGHLSGVVLIAGVGFTCAQLMRHRELTAILASGVSLTRVGRPFLAVATVVTVLQAMTQEFAVPRVAALLAREPEDAGRHEAGAFAVRPTSDAEGRLWYAGRFEPQDRIMRDVFIWERDAKGNLLRTITAASAKWDGSGWLLESGVAKPVADPRGGVAAAPSVPTVGIKTSLDPAMLKVRYLQGFAQSLSSAQLHELARSPSIDERTSQRLERARWGRWAGWMANLVALWGSLSIFLVKTPSAMIFAALKAAPLAFGGFAAGAVASSAAIPGLPIWFAAFVPCLLLLSISVALASGVET